MMGKKDTFSPSLSHVISFSLLLYTDDDSHPCYKLVLMETPTSDWILYQTRDMYMCRLESAFKCIDQRGKRLESYSKDSPDIFTSLSSQ